MDQVRAYGRGAAPRRPSPTSSADSRNDDPALPQPLRQVAALDVLGDDVAEAVVGPAHVVDRDDVRVVEPGEDPGLGQVGLDVLGAGDPLGVGHLDRHRAVEVVVVGQVDPSRTRLDPAAGSPGSGRSDRGSPTRHEVGANHPRECPPLASDSFAVSSMSTTLDLGPHLSSPQSSRIILTGTARAK